MLQSAKEKMQTWINWARSKSDEPGLSHLSVCPDFGCFRYHAIVEGSGNPAELQYFQIQLLPEGHPFKHAPLQSVSPAI